MAQSARTRRTREWFKNHPDEARKNRSWESFKWSHARRGDEIADNSQPVNSPGFRRIIYVAKLGMGTCPYLGCKHEQNFPNEGPHRCKNDKCKQLLEVVVDAAKAPSQPPPKPTAKVMEINRNGYGYCPYNACLGGQYAIKLGDSTCRHCQKAIKVIEETTVYSRS